MILNVPADIARRMVCEWGMSKLGPLAFEKRSGGSIFGNAVWSPRSQRILESKAEEIDQEVSKFINEGYATAVKDLNGF